MPRSSPAVTNASTNRPTLSAPKAGFFEASVVTVILRSPDCRWVLVGCVHVDTTSPELPSPVSAAAGYDPLFLSAFLAVPLPVPPASAAVRELPSTHFTVLLDLTRRLAVATGVNIDGRRCWTWTAATTGTSTPASRPTSRPAPTSTPHLPGPIADVAALTGLDLGPLVTADRLPVPTAAAGRGELTPAAITATGRWQQLSTHADITLKHKKN